MYNQCNEKGNTIAKLNFTDEFMKLYLPQSPNVIWPFIMF